MRQCLAAWAAAVLLLCAGCAGKPAGITQEQVQEAAAADFSVTAEMQYGELDATLRLLREGGRFTAQVEEPEALRGLCLHFDGETVEAEYLGLSFALQADSLPAKAAAGLLAEVFSAVAEPGGIAFELADHAAIVTGETAAGPFSLRLDPQSGRFLSLSIPSADFEVAFG